MQQETKDILVVKEYLYTYPLNFVHTELESKGWSSGDIDNACKLYRHYILLRRLYPLVNLPPSPKIDEVWRLHILNSRAYLDFCNVIFGGKCLEHTCDTKENLEYQYTEITSPLMHKEFGTTDSVAKRRGLVECTIRPLMWFWKNARWATASVLVAVIGTVLQIIYSHNASIDSQYTKLENYVTDLCTDEQESYLLCHSKVRTEDYRFFTKATYDRHLRRANHLTSFVNVAKKLQRSRYVTDDARKELHLFAGWNNDLYKLGFNICSANLRSFDESDLYRDKISKVIWKSHQKFLW